MPKRPCAIAISKDDSTIISADKFGDVYSLPLLVSETNVTSKLLFPTPMKPFAPAANTLTVHSERNRKALENQKRQSNRPKKRAEPQFEHSLLLGHVSMLTDLVLGSVAGRDYILTADRDEHIRVSRGIPMAYVIEGYCLGHSEFISRLCIPKKRPEVLISGGGDDVLFVWNWLRGEMLSKHDLRPHIGSILANLDVEVDQTQKTLSYKIAVSAIYQLNGANNSGKGSLDLILVTCEGIPAILAFSLVSQNELQHEYTLMTQGNVLDVSDTGSVNGFVISIDTAHEIGSTKRIRGLEPEMVAPLQAYTFINESQVAPETISFDSRNETVDDSAGLQNLLYGLENLRKRDGGWRDED